MKSLLSALWRGDVLGGGLFEKSPSPIPPLKTFKKELNLCIPSIDKIKESNSLPQGGEGGTASAVDEDVGGEAPL